MSKNPSRDEFFIGYAKMPPRLRLFTLLIALVGLAGSAGLAFGLFIEQEPPPQTSFTRAPSYSGVFQAEPYPILHIAPSEQDPDGGTIVLHRPAKHGIPDEQARELDGKAVQVGGFMFERSGGRLMQVNISGPDQLRLADPATPGVETWVAATPQSMGRVTIKGKIVDHKCYLGGMIPGQGKTHRGCAIYCLASGVPPLFVSFRPDGEFSTYVLADPDGTAIDPDLLRYLAQPIEVSGDLERLGNLLVFKIDRESIRVL